MPPASGTGAGAEPGTACTGIARTAAGPDHRRSAGNAARFAGNATGPSRAEPGDRPGGAAA